ncbi:MAG: thiol oxidoreductase, partial [Rhodobacteraceae bacterium]|nr:thiol oxidoreductase [Paracoccaceae bacterium]
MTLLLRAACVAVIGSAAMAGPFDEPHLNILPRTDAEAARIAEILSAPESFDAPERFEAKSAGAASVRATNNSNAFSLPSGNITFEDELNFKVGNGLFKKLWVSSPSSTLASDGLGPLYNARSCQRCHIKDGRGHPPEGPLDNSISMFLRVSIPGEPKDAITEIEDYIATRPDPNYGTQLQDFSLAGHPAEYRLQIDYEEIEVALSGGETAWLRKPTYSAEDLGYGALHPEAMLSPRVAPQMIGLGLLEAIPAADILAGADPDDLDGNDISGRPNIVWSVEYDQPMLGRFGLKAG